METPIKSPVEEISRIRACFDDLIRITALPGLSTGREPSQIAAALLDALVGMLPLSFAYIRLSDPDGGQSIEIARVAEVLDPTYGGDIGDALKMALGHGRLWPRTAQVLIGDVEYSIASTSLGLQGELGVVVAGSQGLDFPEQTEALLLDVAANHTAIALHHARLLIAQRTPEPATPKDELERSEHESWRFIDSIPGPIATLTKTGAVEMVNRHLLDYFGATIEDARHWETNDLVHPEDLPHLIDLFRRSTESGTPYESEHRLRRSDGVYRWFQSRGVPLRDANGDIVRWYWLLTDIDDRKRAEEALRASEGNLQLIIDTLPALAWSTRADGFAEFFNRHYLDYTGLSAEQARGWNWTTAIHADDLDGLTASWQRIMAAGEPGEAEARIRRFDGTYRWFLFRANPLRDESGNIVKWYGTNLDIDDRKRGEEALRTRELSWRQIVDNIPGLVATWDARGEVEFLNRQTLEYFGKTNEELKSWSLIDAVHPDDLARVIETRAKHIETGRVYESEHRCRRADGVYRWFQVRGLPVRDAEGAITAWYLLLTDIDDRKKAEEALQSSERDLSLMINAIPCWSSVFDSNGSVLHRNQVVSDYTGFTLEDARKEDFRARVFHPDDVERLREERRQAFTRPVPFENEQRVLGKDGKYRWFLFRYKPLLDDQGRIRRWYTAAFDIDDRKRAEEQLEQAYLLLAEAQRLSKTGSFITDLLADEHNWSEEARRIFEFDPGTKVTVHTFREKIHPEDLPSIDAVLARGVAGVDADIVFRILTSGGMVKHIHGIAHATHHIEGRPVFIGALQDVTESKLAEGALRASERNLKLTIDTIPALAWTARVDGSADFLNRHYLDYVGLSAEEARDWSWAAAVHPDDLNGLAAMWERVMASEEAGETEARLRRHDGEYRWFLFRASPLRDENGNIVKWYGINTDIDDRKRAEAQVEQAYLRLAEAQRLSKTGSFITDLVVDDHNWSEEAFRIFEFDPANKVTVQMIRDTVHPEDLPLFDSVISRGMTGEDVDFVFRIVTPRSGVKHIRGMARVMEQVAGRPLFIGALQDVTEGKLAEDALRQAQAELSHVTRMTTLGELTASIAHEVNQPLSGIVSNGSACLRWLAGDAPDLNEIREALVDIVRDGTRAGEVIARIRALATKRTALPREKLDLNETIQEILLIVGDEAKRKSVMIRTQFGAEVFPVLGDRVQLQQVVLNLVMNGLEAMSGVSERARELVITTRNVHVGQAQVTVEDSGTGLDPNTMARIFDPFYTTKPTGMGMGLSISRSILQNHGGRLWATPNNGPGTSFHFTLPRCHGEEEHAEVAGG